MSKPKNPPTDRCNALCKQGEPGRLCSLVAGHGTSHKGVGRCKFHGGGSPLAEKAGQLELARRHAEATLTQELAGRTIVPLADPIATLEQTVAEAVMWAGMCRDKVSGLGDDMTTWTAGTGEQVRALVGLYERAIERSQRFLEAWHRLGMDDRKARFDEAQVQLGIAELRAAMAAVLDDQDAALSPYQKEALKAAVGVWMRPDRNRAVSS